MSEQIYTEVTNDVLLSKVSEMKNSGYVLIQISVTRGEKYDIIYSFEKDYELINLRLYLADNEEVESVSSLYPYSFLYENEMKELFGIKVKNINLDFNGTLYVTAAKTPPFNTKAPEGKVE